MRRPHNTVPALQDEESEPLKGKVTEGLIFFK